MEVIKNFNFNQLFSIGILPDKSFMNFSPVMKIFLKQQRFWRLYWLLLFPYFSMEHSTMPSCLYRYFNFNMQSVPLVLFYPNFANNRLFMPSRSSTRLPPIFWRFFLYYKIIEDTKFSCCRSMAPWAQILKSIDY